MKRIIAVIIALSLFGVSVYAFSGESLKMLGVKFSDDESRLVLRADFTEDVLNILGIEKISGIRQVFNDVSEDDSCFDGVMTAYQAGIIHGGPDMKFRPYEPITYDEAVRILVDVLKYDSYVRAGKDYLSTAKMIGLLDGVKYGGSNYVNEESKSGLLLNFTDIPVLEIEYESGGMKFNTGGETVLKKQNIYKGRGIVKGVSDAALDSNIKTGDSFITIENEVFSTNGKNFDGYLGMMTDYLYKEYDGAYTVIAMEMSKQSEVVEIPLYDVTEYSEKVVYYKSADKKKQIRLSDDVVIVYNGAPVEKLSADLFAGDNGKVRFINNNSKYSAVIIEEYDDYFAENVDVKNKTVYDKYNIKDGKPRSLDLSQIASDKFVTAGGKMADISGVEKYSVLSVMRRRNGELVKVVLNSASADGKITDFDNIENSVCVEGKNYRVTNNVLKNDTVSVGRYGTYYLNVYNAVAGIRYENSGVMQYGYAINVWADEAGDGCFIKLLTQDNTIEKHETAEKLTLDGARSRYSADDIKKPLSDSIGFLPQVIRYSMDSDGRISILDTLVSNKEDSNNKLINCYGKKDNIRYRKLGQTFGNHLLVSDSTIIFKVPDESAANARGSFPDSKYKAVTISEFQADQPYTIAGYSSEPDSYVPELIVNYSSSEAIATASGIAVVSRINQGINSEGEVVPSIIYYMEGAEEQGIFKEAGVLDGIQLKVGDVIRIAKDKDGEISKVQHIYSVDDGNGDTVDFRGGVTGGAVDTHAQFNLVKAHIYKKGNGTVSFAKRAVIESKPELSLDDVAVYNTAAAAVLIYDSSEVKKVRQASMSEAAEFYNGEMGDMAIIHTNYSQLKTVYIIK